LKQEVEIMDMVRGYIFNRCHQYPFADDMMSYVRCEAIKAFVTFDAMRGASLTAWVLYKTKHAIQQYWTRRHYRAGRQYDVVLPFEVGQHDAQDAHGAHELSEHTKSAIRRIVDKLADSERRLIVDHFWGGKTLQRIADESGVSESRVCQVMKKILNRMKEAA